MGSVTTGIGTGIAGIIDALEGFSAGANEYASNLITAMLILEIALLGYMVAIGKVNNGAEILWKIFTMGVSLWIAAHLRQLAVTCLDAFLWFAESLAGSSFSADIKNPAATLTEIIGSNFTVIWTFAGTQYGGISMILERIIICACACFMVLIMMLAIINYYLAYIHYLVALTWGIFIFPFTLFRPLHFIGENVIKGIFAHILKLGVIYFTLIAGIFLMKDGMAVSANELSKDGILLFLLEKVVTCLVVFYIIKSASVIAGEIVCGTPGHTGLSFGEAVKAAGIAASAAAVGSVVAGKGVHSSARTAAAAAGSFLQAREEGKTGMQSIKMGMGTMGRMAGQEIKERLGELKDTMGNTVRRKAGLQSISFPRQSMSVREAFNQGKTETSGIIEKQKNAENGTANGEEMKNEK